MTNYQWIKNNIEDKKAISRLFCKLSECETCPVRNDCHIPYGNGFYYWLNEQWEVITNAAECEYEPEKSE